MWRAASSAPLGGLRPSPPVSSPGIGRDGHQDVALLDLADLLELPADPRTPGHGPGAGGNPAQALAVVRQAVIVECLPAADVFGRFLVRVALVDPAARPHPKLDLP